ncbi:hypothetical protein TrVFT333_004149 [Trichoderma virens FT-333]|nr:hypothetical protein TrVFT333_004149 [Trichoderma virens FT-333]
MNQQGDIYRVKRRACVTCTKAKSKCLPQTDNLCQRCARLGKQCAYLDLPERKRKRKDDDSRVDALEGKIEELTAQLVALRNGVSSQDGSRSASTNGTASSTEPSSVTGSIPEASYGDSELLDAEPEGFHGPSKRQRLMSRNSSLASYGNSPSSSSPSQTVEMLRKQEPLLFLAVIAATIPSAHAIRKLLADEIMQHITSRIVASSERNLGLLRALLVLCAWYRYPAQRGNFTEGDQPAICNANLFHCNMHYINIAIRDLALDDEYLSYQSRHAFAQSRSAQSFKTSPFRCSLLWLLLRHSKALINAYIDIPDAELPQVTVFTIAQLCASLIILPRSVSTLLKLIVRNHPRASIQGDVLNEARAVIDEADYLNLVVRLYDRLRLLIAGLSTQEKGLDVVGTLCCHMAVLASSYAPRMKAILGVDLVDEKPIASITPPAITIDDIIAANASANAAALMQQTASHNVNGLNSVDEHQGGSSSYTGAEDGSYLFSDELWSSVLESFTSFV